MTFSPLLFINESGQSTLVTILISIVLFLLAIVLFAIIQAALGRNKVQITEEPVFTSEFKTSGPIESPTTEYTNEEMLKKVGIWDPFLVQISFTPAGKVRLIFNIKNTSEPTQLIWDFNPSQIEFRPVPGKDFANFTNAEFFFGTNFLDSHGWWEDLDDIEWSQIYEQITSVVVRLSTERFNQLTAS